MEPQGESRTDEEIESSQQVRFRVGQGMVMEYYVNLLVSPIIHRIRQ